MFFSQPWPARVWFRHFPPQQCSLSEQTAVSSHLFVLVCVVFGVGVRFPC